MTGCWEDAKEVAWVHSLDWKIDDNVLLKNEQERNIFTRAITRTRHATIIVSFWTHTHAPKNKNKQTRRQQRQR